MGRNGDRRLVGRYARELSDQVDDLSLCRSVALDIARGDGQVLMPGQLLHVAQRSAGSTTVAASTLKPKFPIQAHEARRSLRAAGEEEGGLSPRVAPFADLRDLGALLQRAGFALPVTDSEAITVRYDSVFGLMNDLRRMGATNALVDRRRTPLKRATLLRMAEIYRQRFADADGRVRATFEFLWLSGWAPHPDQQRPLKPGSAQARLADALGTRELPAGEKAGK